MNSSSELGMAADPGGRSVDLQFFECLPVACYACDRSGTIVGYNRKVVNLWGREPVITDRFTGAYRVLNEYGDPLAMEDTATASLLRWGLTEVNKELVIEKPDGKRLVVLSNVAPLHDEEGRTIGALDVLHDVTDRRRLEDARRTAERMSAYARLAAQVAHLKPALLSIVSLLDQLGREATLSQEARGYTELARLELVRFDTLVKHMAQLSGAA